MKCRELVTLIMKGAVVRDSISISLPRVCKGKFHKGHLITRSRESDSISLEFFSLIDLHCNICHLYITISSGIILIISFDIRLLEYSSILLIILFGILLLEYSICPLSDCLPGYFLPGHQQPHVSPSWLSCSASLLLEFLPSAFVRGAATLM